MKMNPVLQSIIFGALTVFLIAILTRNLRADVRVQYIEHGLDIGHLVTALKTVEHWDGKTPGARGEWGELQMMPAMRKLYGNDFRAYVRYLILECKKLHKQPSAWLVGLLHNAGYPAVRDHKELAAKLDFAERVENVYNDLNR